MMTKALILALVLTLCLGAMGVGYAVWGEDMYIEGTVETGYVDTEWSLKSCSDNDGDPGWGEVTATISPDMNTLNVEIINAYPGYEATINCDMHNVGTVPAEVGPMDLTGVPPELSVELIGDIFTEGIVLYPCNEKLGIVKVLVGDTVQPSTTYSFSVVVDPHAWSP